MQSKKARGAKHTSELREAVNVNSILNEKPKTNREAEI
jgi:hypothetical protein